MRANVAGAGAMERNCQLIGVSPGVVRCQSRRAEATGQGVQRGGVAHDGIERERIEQVKLLLPARVVHEPQTNSWKVLRLR